LEPDILAVQEVDGEAALRRVVERDIYDVHDADRAKGSLNGQQNTGFAVRRGLTVVRQPAFAALAIRGDGSLRCGARIELTHNGHTLQVMAVPVKSRCFENSATSSACETVLAQVPVLEGWLDTAAEGLSRASSWATSPGALPNWATGSGLTATMASPPLPISRRSRRTCP
jgi:hypothetical protein